MQRHNLFLTTTALGLALSIIARADTRTWNFDNWNEGDSTNLVIASGQLLWDYQNWTGGNPDTGGFLQLTPAASSRNLAVIFPDIDNGAPIKAFKLTADLRVGNGTQTPADGFSISYVRESDRVLANAAIVDPGWEGTPPYQPPIGRLAGFAGGDSSAQTLDPAGSTNPESGTKTGVSVAFDAWAGNWLPDTGSGGGPGPDMVGVFVRVDDKTLIGKPLPTANADCTETNSMQTGPYTGDNSNAGLSWCRLEVEKTVDNKVTVTWKGAKVLDNFPLANYGVHRGRIILAGRCGGSWQNVDFDNITLTTVPAIEATFESLAINADLKGWTFQLKDTGASKVSRITSVIWNGNNVTASVVTNRIGDVTTGTYTQATRFAAGSVQHVEVTFVTDLTQTLSGIGDATTPAYRVMPAAYALPLSSVSTATRGIALGPTWQTWAVNGNSQGNNKLNWTEEQILGVHGANLITGTWPTSADVLDYQNNSGDPTIALSGNFRYNGSLATPPLWDGPDYDIKTLGFGSGGKTSTDDGTIEWFAYVNFPTAGAYYMVVNSDDGFRLTTARNAKDRMGEVISSFNDGRGNGTGLDAGTIQRVEVDTAGVYPIRGIIENQGGGFNVEWYTRNGSQLDLVNGTSGGALQAWQSATGTGCYVDKALPVRDAVDVVPTQKIIVDLADGNGSTVVPGSIVMKLDGAVVSPTRTGLHLELTPPGVLGAWASGSSHTIELTFTDSATKAYTYAWGFKVLTYQIYQGPYATGGKWNLYAVVRAPLTWAEAKLAAESMVEPTQGKHGHLVTIHSTAEADFVRMIAGGESVWIGLTDKEVYGGSETGSDPAQSSQVPPVTGQWVWVTGEPYTFARWNGGEPNDWQNGNPGEDAIEMTSNGLFNDNGIGINGESAPTRQYVVEFETLFPVKIDGISYSILPSGPLPGPSGCDGVFGIRAIHNAGNIPTITAAVNALSAPGTTVVDTTSPVINFNDLDGSQGGGGIFGGELPLPGNIAGNDENCLIVAKTKIEILQGGAYTFGVHSDDGFALRIRGQNWASVSGNGEIAINDPTTITYQYGTGDANTRGVVNLAPGVYDLEFVWFENGGGAFVELYAANGAYTCDSESSYRLLSGQPMWLAKPGVSAAGWTVEYDAPGGTALNSIADAEAALVGAPSVSGVSAINYRDPDDQGGAQGCSHPFPQDTPGAADDDFAIRATAQLVIPVAGTYQFGFAGDDGGYLQIEGRTWDRIVYTADGNVGRINGDRIQFDANTGNSRTVGEITLPAGTYTMRALFWERGGGAWFWVFGGLPGDSLGVLSAGNSGLIHPIAIAPCTPRPTIIISHTATSTVLNFTGAKLLSSDNATGPFAEIPGATSPYIVPAGGTAKYYRSAN